MSIVPERGPRKWADTSPRAPFHHPVTFKSVCWIVLGLFLSAPALLAQGFDQRDALSPRVFSLGGGGVVLELCRGASGALS